MSKKKALSFNQFIKRFPNEEACFEYLYKIKWPNGFDSSLPANLFENAVLSRRFACFVFLPYGFSLVFALTSRNKGNSLSKMPNGFFSGQ